MTYKQAVDYIHSLEKFGIKPGLDRIRTLCEALGNPQDDLRFIHIAGTNGKGSTSTFCSEILVKAGFKTGLFTSPYVTDFRERICLNGEMIPENDLARYTGEVKDAIEKTGLLITEFEAITAVAFLYFSAVKCDIAVLEVGLGGRFDATNIIKPPLVAGIVSISLDHMNVLGNTVSEIAFEKCGIIKPGSKVVSYPMQTDEAYGVIAAQSEKNGCRLIVPDIRSLSIDEINSSFSRFTYKGEEYRINLPGEHMIYNAVTAVEIIGALGEKIKEDSVREGLASTAMPARMEKISENPDIIIDGGHNAACAVALKRCLDGNYRGRDIIMVSSIMEDKDYNTYLKTVAPAAKIFIATKANISRALSSDKLCRAAEKFCGKCFDVPSPSVAVKKALSLAGKEDVIVICGSFYLAGDIRAELTERGEKND
ncbi:MAG: bifunctional folylpolyglutamate synthase/dihydrofolate synthase [Clostridia bacterium]|nr:bifunctional folylpolyglutamate synthase/dihydrofolate synthase [Clostridia bacterium]